jgi:ParB family transcriptional regulator, chromosome partitioning protein
VGWPSLGCPRYTARCMATRAIPAKKVSRKTRKVETEPALKPAELAVISHSSAQRELEAQVLRDGGSVLATYREPLGGQVVMLVALPIGRVRASPLQRDISEPHARELMRAMEGIKRFLDPIIVVRRADKYVTPNGAHRLVAMKELGANTITGVLVPEAELAHQILALNTQKPHSLKERAIEVARIYREVDSSCHESDCQFSFEEPVLVTLGFACEQQKRLAVSAYYPALRRVDYWLLTPLSSAAQERERRAARVVELDDAIGLAVRRLQKRGITSPDLRSLLVAKVNPLRLRGEQPDFDGLLDAMIERARGLRTERIELADLVRTSARREDE